MYPSLDSNENLYGEGQTGVIFLGFAELPQLYVHVHACTGALGMFTTTPVLSKSVNPRIFGTPIPIFLGICDSPMTSLTKIGIPANTNVSPYQECSAGMLHCTRRVLGEIKAVVSG